jgi:hypothetical protein
VRQDGTMKETCEPLEFKQKDLVKSFKSLACWQSTESWFC